MPDFIVFSILFLSVIASCFSFIVWLSTSGSDVHGSIPLCAILIAVLCGMWFLVASQHEKVIDKEIIAKSATVNNVQCVVFNDDEASYYYNLNGRFARTFEDGTEFKLVFYSNGPYVGLYFDFKKGLKENK